MLLLVKAFHPPHLGASSDREPDMDPFQIMSYSSISEPGSLSLDVMHGFDDHRDVKSLDDELSRCKAVTGRDLVSPSALHRGS